MGEFKRVNLEFHYKCHGDDIALADRLNIRVLLPAGLFHGTCDR